MQTARSSLAIVAATRGDLAVVSRLAHTIWHEHYRGIITAAQIDYMLERGLSEQALTRFLDDEPRAGLALAIVDGIAAGFASWYRADEPATSRLDKLYVAAGHRRLGLGRRLIEHVEAMARADGAATLILSVNKRNTGSIRAYERCGFSVREAVVVDIGQGFVMDDFVLAKPL